MKSPRRSLTGHYLAILLVLSVGHCAIGQTITYVGVMRDQTDFSPDGLNIGKSGYWFPQFDAPKPVRRRPTTENARDALPAWAGPINHTTSVLELAGFLQRSFSQDKGGVRAKGGQPSWNFFTLPNGAKGLSGSLVDPNTRGNLNNTVNRIQLSAGTTDDPLPNSFLLHVVVDNTDGAHNPDRRLRARGAGPEQEDVGCMVPADELIFNGIADVYSFRYAGFKAGDYIKIQLSASAENNEGAGISGFLLDALRAE